MDNKQTQNICSKYISKLTIEQIYNILEKVGYNPSESNYASLLIKGKLVVFPLEKKNSMDKYYIRLLDFAIFDVKNGERVTNQGKLRAYYNAMKEIFGDAYVEDYKAYADEIANRKNNAETK